MNGGLLYFGKDALRRPVMEFAYESITGTLGQVFNGNLEFVWLDFTAHPSQSPGAICRASCGCCPFTYAVVHPQRLALYAYKGLKARCFRRA